MFITYSLYFSNNQNQFFSIDIDSGNFNWETKINSNLRPVVIGNILFTISLEGYLFLIDKNKGSIIRVTDIFDNFKLKKRNLIEPTGFILGKDNIYLSTNKVYGHNPNNFSFVEKQKSFE